MADHSGDNIFEEREDLMVSSTGGTPTLRVAHFLKPTVASISGPTLKPPSISLSSESKRPLKVAFKGMRIPQTKWRAWVDRMHSIYQSLWKEVGIYEAVMASTYTIRTNNDLIFGVAERWCSETNSFIFPWGEATITLEDMIILGGYSVLGAPVSGPSETTEWVEIEENLTKERKELIRSTAQKATHSQWMKRFMDSGRELEHEAFLCLWLSRFVYPGNVHDTICKHVFPIAIRLARRTRIALAPVVLASLYRDLGLLKETMVASSQLEDKSASFLALTLWAPLQLVQIWIWERFPPLRPKPKVIGPGEPRLARWCQVKKLDIDDVRSAIDSAGNSFQWRPYAMAMENWSQPKFYKEKEEWVSVSLDVDEELESFARCLRVCELVGMDCTEQYLPHRVAMQFGIDQDLPGWVTHSNKSPQIAWNSYSRPISDVKLYIPSRLFESDVTTRYLEWWKKSVFTPKDAIEGVVRGQRSSRRSKVLLRGSRGAMGGTNTNVSSSFPPNCLRMETGECRNADVPPGFSSKSKRLEATGDNAGDVPPGFPPKFRRVQVKGGHGDDVPLGFAPKCNSTGANKNNPVTMLRSSGEHLGDRGSPAGNDKPLLAIKSEDLSSSSADNEALRKVRKVEMFMKPVEEISQCEVAKGRTETATEDANDSKDGSLVHNAVSINRDEGESSRSISYETPALELEARISRLERLVAGLKAARFANRCVKKTNQSST